MYRSLHDCASTVMALRQKLATTSFLPENGSIISPSLFLLERFTPVIRGVALTLLVSYLRNPVPERQHPRPAIATRTTAEFRADAGYLY